MCLIQFITSSNSSFTECVRYSYNFLSSHPPFITNNACPASPVQDQAFIKYKCDSGSGTHSFKHCSWDNSGLASNGGAIHLVYSSPQSSISLTVEHCIFLHCHETGTVDGGAIYVKYINTASVSNSFFYDCECGTAPGQEGGGICYSYLSTNPSIARCSFISCVSADDGGGCGIWLSNASSVYAINSCRFLKCKGLSETGSEGGGSLLYKNENFITFSNCLFSDCSAPVNAGGVCIYSLSGTTVKPIKFCFFHENKSNGFRDATFYYFDDSPQIITYSFSTASSNRVSVYNSTDRYHYLRDNWPPYATINSKLTTTVCEQGHNENSLIG